MAFSLLIGYRFRLCILIYLLEEFIWNFFTIYAKILGGNKSERVRNETHYETQLGIIVTKIRKVSTGN